MEKIIQIATCGAENGHSLYALTEDGKLYERVYYVNEGTPKVSKPEWLSKKCQQHTWSGQNSTHTP